MDDPENPLIPAPPEAKNRAWRLLEQAEADLEAGRVTEEDWYRRIADVITPAYLAADNPRAQSGSSADKAGWEHARGLIADAIDRDGAFLDVGCASGLLMESIREWADRKGHNVEPYGLDIAPELADLARTRLPCWADRVWTGNVMTWEPPRRFDYVRTGLEYVPKRRACDLVERLLTRFLVPDGCLIIGTVNEEAEGRTGEPITEDLLAGWGFTVAGRSERPHRDPRLVYRVLWLYAPEWIGD